MKFTTSAITIAALTVASAYDYVDTHHWADEYEMCARPDNSPINIKPKQAMYDADYCEPELEWEVDWTVHSWSIRNSGHSISVTPLANTDTQPDFAEEAIIEANGNRYTTRTTRENTIARLPNYFLPSGSDNSEFCLHSFHFHWGLHDDEGSEHTILNDFYPLEVHFVHYSCARPNISQALGPYGSGEAIDAVKEDGGDPYELAVVGIFFELKEWDNPVFESILPEDTLETIRYPGHETDVVTDSLFLQNLIPEGLFTEGYYSYEGSLTTPPCTSIVRWHVSNAKSYIGRKQLDRFRELMTNNITKMAPNYRKTVANEHQLYACMKEPTNAPVSVDDEAGIIKILNKTVIYKESQSLDQNYTWVWAIVVVAVVAIAAGAFVYTAHLKKQERRESFGVQMVDA